MSLKQDAPVRLLLLGDSIRRSYQPAVTDAGSVGNAFDVVGMPLDINCGDTCRTLRLVESLDTQLKPTCIHWNNGLHDVKRCVESGLCLVPLEEYQQNIRRLLETFQNICGDHVIWCRTTPVIESRHNNGRAYTRLNQDINLYNAAADAIMHKAGVFIHDLHKVLKEQVDENICGDGVHLTDAGIRLAAESVVKHVQHYQPTSHGSSVTVANK